MRQAKKKKKKVNKENASTKEQQFNLGGVALKTLRDA